MLYYTHINYKEDLDRGGTPYRIIGNLIQLNNSNPYAYYTYLGHLGIPCIDMKHSHITWIHHNADGAVQYDPLDITNVPDVDKYLEELFTEEVFNNAARHRLNKVIGLV